MTNFKQGKTYINQIPHYYEEAGWGIQERYYKITKRTDKTIWWKRVDKNGQDSTAFGHKEKYEGKCKLNYSTICDNYEYRQEYFIIKFQYTQYTLYCENLYEKPKKVIKIKR